MGRVLIWRLILEDFITDIEYIQGNKNIVADTWSRPPWTKTKILHTSPLIKNTFPEINDIEELPEGILLAKF